jgi:hypothetical protein
MLMVVFVNCKEVEKPSRFDLLSNVEKNAYIYIYIYIYIYRWR